MRYYIVTTAKFADQCLEYLTYGSTQSNWLANIDVDDIVFLSQFNYKSQQIFGPFRVSKTMFYNKTIIYPAQRFFYRIQLAPLKSIQSIDETDLYLSGIQSGNLNYYSRLISLIQQNKHLHCISLNEKEGMAIKFAFKNFGNLLCNLPSKSVASNTEDVNSAYVWQKNRVDRKRQFVSEADLETYILLSLKNRQSNMYKAFNEIVTKHSGVELKDSIIYNQFIFGNAYPADIVILNDHSLNVFELKKDVLTSSMVPQVEKEIKKHLYFSIFSERTAFLNGTEYIFNFYLVCLSQGNNEVQDVISRTYESLQSKIRCHRKNNLIYLEYEPRNDDLFIREI